MPRNPSLSTPWAWGPPLIALLLIVVIYITNGNESLFLALNHLGQLLGDDCWANLTILGDGAVATALVLPFIRRYPRRFWAALFAAVITAFWVQALKNWINVPRPLAVFSPDQFFHSGPAFRAGSFPSGHAASIAALTGIWIVSLPGKLLLRLVLLALAIVVSLSRIMTGVHWPIDVLGGVAGGWLAACIGLWLSDRCGWKTSGIAGFSAGLVLIGVAASLLVSHHMGYPSAMLLQRLLAVVCLVWGGREMYLMLPRRRSAQT
ncbi:MAG: hypothetical protein JWM42_198 [Burkholderia sp.]|nr:hypothetical protein [Burkholderia sp.]